VITTSYGFEYCFKANFCCKDVDDVIPVLFNYPGRLTDNLNQVAGTGYSFSLSVMNMRGDRELVSSAERSRCLLQRTTEGGR
jgi:hypothetical protein